MAYSKSLSSEYTCPTCGHTGTDFVKEFYDHAPSLQPIIICDDCGVGHEVWEM